MGVQLACTTWRGTLWHRDIIVAILFFLFLRHTRGRAFWHDDVIVSVLCTQANRLADLLADKQLTFFLFWCTHRSNIIGRLAILRMASRATYQFLLLWMFLKVF